MTKTQKRKIIERDKKCVECSSTDRLTVDHIIPLSRGGTNIPENLRTLCLACNVRKGSFMKFSVLERITVALHVDEHITNLKNEFKGMIASYANSIQDKINTGIQNSVVAVWVNIRAKDTQINSLNTKIEALEGKIVLLEKHFGIEYVNEIKTVNEYRKVKK